MNCEDDSLMETPTNSPRIEPQDNQTVLDYEQAVAASMEEYDKLRKEDKMEDIQETPPKDNGSMGDALAPQFSLQGKLNKDAMTPEMVDDEYSKYSLLVEYALDKRSQLPMLNCENADTLIYIDPPPRTRIGDGVEDTSYSDEVIIYRMRSKDLLATDSPYLRDALGPTRQFRTLRRRNLVSSALPEGIKFVLDLTPPVEGDAAVDLTTELSCSKGIRNWFHAEKRWNIPLQSVGGHDDLEESLIIRRCLLQGSNWAVKTSTRGGEGSKAANDTKPSIPMDYTAIRHRSAIERTLHIIAGGNPKIDSAPKMWSVFAVAKFLKCPSTVTDHIIGWIYNGPNSRFIEVLPEVSLRIADGLQNPMLCRDAFSILVGEEALASAGKDAFGRYGKRRARRIGEDLDLESFVTRIEYASKAFADRINKTFIELARAEWIRGLSGYETIEAFCRSAQSNKRYILEDYIDILQRYVQGRIRDTLLRKRDYDSDENLNPIGFKYGADLVSHESYSSIYNNMLPRESLLTRSFWYQMSRMELDTPNREITSFYSDSQHPLGLETINTVSLSELLKETEKFNEAAYEVALETAIKANRDMQEASAADSSWMKFYSPTTGVLSQLTTQLPIRTRQSESAIPLLQPETLAPASYPLRIVNPDIRAEEFDGLAHQRGVQQGGEPSMDPSCRLFGQPYPEIQELSDRYAEQLDEMHQRPSVQLDLVHEEIPDGPIFITDSPPLDPDGTAAFRIMPFNVYRFLKECTNHITSVAYQMNSSNNLNFDPALTDTLFCLDENEFQFLPLYAGGNDDETGGVFEQELPNAVGGPIGPGPSYHVSNSSAASSEFELVSVEGSGSFDTSLAVEDGFSDCLDRRVVYSDDGLSDFGRLDLKGKGKEKAVEEEDEKWLEDFVFAGKGKGREDVDVDDPEEDMDDVTVAENGSDGEEFDEDEYFETDGDIIAMD